MQLNIYVPEPEPEETLHSLLVTAWRLSSYLHFRGFTREIFKVESDGRGWSGNYKRLCSYLDPCRATGWAMLQKMLLIPYLTPFVGPGAAYADSRNHDLYRRIGSADAKPRQGWYCSAPLRYCPLCVQMQLRRLGRSIWLRPHQLGRVEVCWCHSVKLVSVMQHRTQPLLPHEFEEQTVRYSFDRSEIWLARQSHELLVANHPSYDRALRQQVLREQAVRLGYAKSGRIDIYLIALHLLRTFGRHFFERVMETSDAEDLARYVRLILFADDPRVRPINQLLCIQALFGDQKRYFDRLRSAGAAHAAEPVVSGSVRSAQAVLHRDIFLTLLKASGTDVMTDLAQSYPMTHDWIRKNALAWSRRKIAELVQGSDRVRVLRRRAGELLARRTREREHERRRISAIGGEQHAVTPQVDSGDLAAVASQLRRR